MIKYDEQLGLMLFKCDNFPNFQIFIMPFFKLNVTSRKNSSILNDIFFRKREVLKIYWLTLSLTRSANIFARLEA